MIKADFTTISLFSIFTLIMLVAGFGFTYDYYQNTFPTYTDDVIMGLIILGTAVLYRRLSRS